MTTPARPRWRILKRILIVLGVLIPLGAGGFGLRLWSSFKGPAPPQCASQSLTRRTFATPQQLSSAQTPGSRKYDVEPSAALLPDGALAMVWNAREHVLKGKSGLVTARISPQGEVTLRPYATDRAEAFDAWMTAGPDGKARMAWLAHDGGRPERNMKIGYSESSDGLTWTPVISAHAPADCPPDKRGCLDKPMIAASPQGVYLAYCSEGMRLTRSELAAPLFGPSVAVGDGCYGDLRIAPSGTIHFVYGDLLIDKKTDPFGDTAYRIAYTRSQDGGKTFQTPIAVSTPDQPVPFYFSNPQVAVDEARELLYVVYPSGTPDGRWDIYLSTSRDKGATFSRIKVNDDAHCASHMTPHAALDPKTGTLHLTWLENRSGTGGLAYAACDPGGGKCGANEAVSDPFASYSYERHLSAWLSEYGSLVLDAERRWLYAVWTQPVDEDKKPISRIFYARAKLP